MRGKSEARTEPRLTLGVVTPGVPWATRTLLNAARRLGVRLDSEPSILRLE